MAYPVHAVTLPAALSGKTNGKLPDNILVDTPGLAGGVTVRLVSPAARAWRALTDAALKAGHTLKATSLFDSYRPYFVQERIFRQRYTTEQLAGRPSVGWNGRRWYQRPRTAAAAVPGTSNHGWALAVDTGEERDSDAAAEDLSNVTLAWLIANEGRFGFSHELQSEPWHIRYWAGDDIPVAVLAYEQSLGHPQTGDDEMPKAIWTTKGYWFCQGGYREVIADPDDMAKVIEVYGNVCWPQADHNGFPTPQLDLPVAQGGKGWSWDEIDRFLGRVRPPTAKV